MACSKMFQSRLSDYIYVWDVALPKSVVHREFASSQAIYDSSKY